MLVGAADVQTLHLHQVLELRHTGVASAFSAGLTAADWGYPTCQRRRKQLIITIGFSIWITLL